MRVVLLDNRDSFVYNLVDLFATLGAEIEVYRNTVPADRVRAALSPTPAEAEAGQRPVLCLSPGPGHPREAGCLMELVACAAIVEGCGAHVGRVGPVHGRSVRVEVTPAGLTDPAFAPLEGGPLDVARYHSLGTRDLPPTLVSLAATAATDPVGAGVVMAARHASRPVVGLQFHPESVLTPAGPAILRALTADLARAR